MLFRSAISAKIAGDRALSKQDSPTARAVAVVNRLVEKKIGRPHDRHGNPFDRTNEIKKHNLVLPALLSKWRDLPGLPKNAHKSPYTAKKASQRRWISFERFGVAHEAQCLCGKPYVAKAYVIKI